jgi:hypothetical protein
MASSIQRDSVVAASSAVLSWSQLNRLTEEALQSLPVLAARSGLRPKSAVAVHELVHWYKTRKWQESSADAQEEIKARLLFARHFCTLMSESLAALEGVSGPVVVFSAGAKTPYLAWVWLIGYLYTNNYIFADARLSKRGDFAIPEHN